MFYTFETTNSIQIIQYGVRLTCSLQEPENLLEKG